MPSWPGSLPQYATLRDMQWAGPSNATIRTPMDVGPSKGRRRTTAPTRFVQVAYAQMTDAQLTTFENWFQNDIAMGALAFTMPHPKDQTTRTWRFADAQSPYQVTPYTRTLWRVTMMLELFPA